MQTIQQRAQRPGNTWSRRLAAVVLVLITVPLIASCGGGEQGNGGGGGQDDGRQAGGGKAGGGGGGGGDQPGGTTGDERMISDLRVIMATPDKKALNGDRARIRSVEVLEKVSDRAFFVGENNAERLLVVNVGKETAVDEGQNVVVVGRLNVPNSKVQERLSLSPEEKSAMEGQGIFLRAQRVAAQKS